MLTPLTQAYALIAIKGIYLKQIKQRACLATKQSACVFNVILGTTINAIHATLDLTWLMEFAFQPILL